MNILFVVSRSVEINTSASIRNSAMMSGLVELGHNVTLISALPDKKSEYYDNSLLPLDVKVRYLIDGKSQKIVNWLKRNPVLKPLKRLISRHSNSSEIYDSQKWVVKHVGKIDFEKYDCIISSSDPKSSHLFVYEGLKNRKKIRWIQIWGDPFYGDISIKNSLNRNEIFAEEKKLLNAADDVYYVSIATLEMQKRNYPESSIKMQYIPIPYLRERIFPLRDLRTANQIRLCYCGDYPTAYRDIRPLYKAVNEMERVYLTICGASDLKLNKTEKVTILPRQGYRNVEKIEEVSDILVHLSNNSGTQIPGKIYQYSGTNKPILFILDGEKEKTEGFFEDYNRYVFSDNTVESIKNSIKKIIQSRNHWNPVKEFDKKSVVKLINLG